MGATNSPTWPFLNHIEAWVLIIRRFHHKNVILNNKRLMWSLLLDNSSQSSPKIICMSGIPPDRLSSRRGINTILISTMEKFHASSFKTRPKFEECCAAFQRPLASCVGGKQACTAPFCAICPCCRLDLFSAAFLHLGPTEAQLSLSEQPLDLQLPQQLNFQPTIPLFAHTL